MVCSNGSYSIVHTTAPIVSWECKIFFPSHNNWKQRVVYIHTTSKGAFKRCVCYNFEMFFRNIEKQNRVLVKNSLESKCPQNCFDNITMRKNLRKTFSVLKFRINLLNFSLKSISQFVKKLIFFLFYTKY